MGNTKTERIYKEISQLPYNEKAILLSKLMLEISTYIGEDRKVNFYDIKGVGKEIWEGIDAQEYVNKERASWE
ncbi:MAG: hypothetical protein U9R01_03205 [candidate division WOR-3 bacterium]|nr:hypothetical protein [candidate division WOR-3 bacterium]